MASGDNQSGTGGDGSSREFSYESPCYACQHSVDVRGVTQIVCLAYLTIRDPLREGECSEFERKRKRFVAGNG
jgi:hypothetical protein